MKSGIREDNVFSDADKALIADVKARITEHISNMIRQPWAKSYLPWDSMYLTGGAIASLLQGETPKDWDFYFDNQAAMEGVQSHLLKFESNIKDVDPKYAEVYGANGKMVTSQAITMDEGSSFITMMVDPPEKLKKSFDFVHCMPHYRDGKLYISYDQFRYAINKQLKENNPLNVKEWRVQKFLQRGYVKV